MRTSIIAAPGVGYVGFIGRHEDAVALVSDRIANGEAFPGERPVRLPRSYARRLARQLYGGSNMPMFMLGVHLRERHPRCRTCSTWHRPSSGCAS